MKVVRYLLIIISIIFLNIQTDIFASTMPNNKKNSTPPTQSTAKTNQYNSSSFQQQSLLKQEIINVTQAIHESQKEILSLIQQIAGNDLNKKLELLNNFCNSLYEIEGPLQTENNKIHPPVYYPSPSMDPGCPDCA